MSLHAEKTLVGQLTLDDNTYYVTNRDGITLDSQAYSNVVVSFGSASYKAGQVSSPEKQGGGYEVGSFSVRLAFGERMREAGVNFNITDVWNNSTAVFRKWTAGDDEWSDCEDFVYGIIKEFSMSEGVIDFTVEAWNPRDDLMLPAVVIEDQTALTDAQAKGTVSYTAVDGSYILSPDKSKFSYGELVRLTNSAGNEEYAYFLRWPGETAEAMYFLSPLQNSYTSANDGTIEKAFRNVPESAIGKTVPIQIGNLTDTVNGIFGKALLINELIGRQCIIKDTLAAHTAYSIGIWDVGTLRYYAAIADEEFTTAADKKSEHFKIDTTTTLSAAITSTVDSISALTVADYTQIKWYDEDDDIPYPVLSANIIMIDTELMLIIQRPYDSTVWVQRGYASSTKATHVAGSAIFQSSKYSARNMLSFIEVFYPEAITNHYFYPNPYYLPNTTVFPDYSFRESWDNLLDADNDNYWRLYWGDMGSSGKYRISKVNFDLQFKKPAVDALAIHCYILAKFGWNTQNSSSGNQAIRLKLIGPHVSDSTAGHRVGTYNASEDSYFTWVFYVLMSAHSSRTFDAISTMYTTKQSIEGGEGYYKPDVSQAEIGGSEVSDCTGNWLPQNLSDLDRRWKFQIQCQDGGSVETNELRVFLYRLGVRMHFLASMGENNLLCKHKGRTISSAVVTICGDDTPTRVGDLLECPVDLLAHFLADELQYEETTDFTARWVTVRNYFVESTNFSDGFEPNIATSYGIDDARKKGWELCEWIASHYNLMLTRAYNGDIDVVNLHEIYYNTPAGTAIDIEEILFVTGSGSRRFSIAQTGTDLIYNDFIVKWRRNNSTDEYQQVYHAPDDLTTHYSGTGLQSIREQYYGAQKRTLEIESPFIYNEYDAIKKVQWEIDDKAEAHFYAQWFIDADHWTEVAGKSEQYRLGDIIYFKGVAYGIDFTATQASDGGGKFYITEILFHDDGNELEIHAKSIQPCKMFTADTESTTGLEIWDDTGGTAITGDHVKDDTGGTGVTGDDIKDDTGG